MKKVLIFQGGWDGHEPKLTSARFARLMEEEGLQTTENKRISVAKPIVMDDEAFFDALTELKDAVYKETGTVREMVQDIVPTYKMPKTGN